MSLTIPQVAEKLGLSTRTIFRKIDKGEIKAFKYGDCKNSPVRITEEALAEYLDKCKLS